MYGKLPRMVALVLVVGLGGLTAYAGILRGASELTGAAGKKNASLDDGLVGYWRFEDTGTTAVDSSGNGNNGVFIESTLTTGRHGQALKLRGFGNSHVSIPASQSLADFTDQITVSAWVYPESPPKDFRVIVSRQIGALLHPDQFYLGFGLLDGRVHYKWHLGTIENGTVNDRSIYRGIPAVRRWIHLVGVYDGTRMSLYVNGVDIGDNEQSGKIQVDDNPVTIGAEENGPESRIVESQFNGQIDEVRLYNRALNPFEIKALYRQPPF